MSELAKPIHIECSFLQFIDVGFDQHTEEGRIYWTGPPFIDSLTAWG